MIWEDIEFGDIAELKNGINFSKEEKGQIGTPTIDVYNMYKGSSVDLSKLYRVNKKIKPDSLLKRGDILFVRSSLKREGIGWANLFNDKNDTYSFCGFIIRARIQDFSILDPMFALYFFRSDVAREKLIVGSGKVAITNISQDIIKKITIPLPSIFEQQKIAAILSLVQQAIEQQTLLIELITELKKALMQKIFSEGLRGEPQKMTEIGPVPESWDVELLGNITNKLDGVIQTGPFGSQIHRHEYQETGIPIVNPTNLINDKINYENLPRVDNAVVKRLNKHVLYEGDILFARRGEIGRHAYVSGKESGWLCGTGCFLVRIKNERFSNKFFHYLFSTPKIRSWLESHSAGAIMPNLNNTVLQKMPIFFPAFDDQTKISTIFETIDNKIFIHIKKKKIFEDLFRTLLHQLMTAQIRVNDLDLSEIEPILSEVSA